MKNKFDQVKDSGKRQEFSTGSVRDTAEGKGRFDLIPFYPLMRLAQHYENGAVKYNPNNWKLGQPLSRYLDSAFRHLAKEIEGWEDEDHASAVAWNIFSYIETKRLIEAKQLPKELNNLPYSLDNVKKNTWRPIPGFVHYEANMLGEIKSLKSYKVLKSWITKHGYSMISFNIKGVKIRKAVHKVIIETFLGTGEGLEVNHINGIKTDNSLDNLEYCTRSENLLHAYKTGLKHGTKHSAKITKKDVLNIRKLVKNGIKQVDLAKRYNIKASSINDIVKRRTWKDVK